MSHHRTYSWLPALVLLCSSPGFAATIYKSIDANGVVSFSDTRPTQEVMVETVIIDDRAAPSGEQAQEKLQELRETTDRMVADRMARERHRAELRELETAKSAQQTAPVIADDYDVSPLYTDYFNYPIQRPWRAPRHHRRPGFPIAYPPLWPPAVRPLPVHDYPASLIRKSYNPQVRDAVNK